MRVTITDLDHQSLAVEQEVADKAGVELLFLDGGPDAGLDPRAKGTEGLIVQYARVDAKVMDYLLPELKVIGRYGVGVDTIDLAAAAERGITVVNVPDYGVQSVADHAITLAMMVARNIPVLERQARASTMDLGPAMPVHQACDQIFGVLGYGAIGRACAQKARGIGFTTMVTDPMLPEGVDEVDGFRVVAQSELLACADIVSIHIPLLPATKHLFNDERFAEMKDGAIVINTSRGAVIDTDALVRALESGKLRGAGLDVLETEPLPTGSRLTELDRVVLTPHAAYYSEESYYQLKRRVVQNTIDVMQGRHCPNIVALKSD